MSDLKVGFLVNTRFSRDNTTAQQLHLLIVRILLYYCYTPKVNLTWGYHLFRSGILNISYKRISLQTIALKPSQKLLSDLISNVTDPNADKNHQTRRTSLENTADGEECSDLVSELDEDAKKEAEMINRSWEEALTMVASDFNWDNETENVLFILTSSLLGDSDRIRSIMSSLKKDKKVKFVVVDLNSLERSRTSMDRVALDQIVQGKYSRQKTCVVPTDLLCSDLSKFCFRQIFRSYLVNEASSLSQNVKFICTETILILDDSAEECPVLDDNDMVFVLSPMVLGDEDRTQFISLKFKMEVSYSFAERYLDHRNCYFVTFDEQFGEFTTSDLPSFSVESVEVKDDKKCRKTYVIKHLTPSVGVMFSLLELADPSDLAQLPRTPEEEAFDLLSFHDLGVDANSADLFRDVSRQFRASVNDWYLVNRTTEESDSHMMEQIKNFHDLHINDSFTTRPSLKQEADNEKKEICEVKETLSTIPENTADTASEEAMMQASPRYYERANITALVRKHQNDIKQELISPSELKEKHSDDTEKLVKEHKIQVVLHLVWYTEFSDMETEEMERAASGVLALLRSLSFLTSPNQMFNFLNDQIVGEFHEDCPDLLRGLYEDGFLMEVPAILCDDSNSLSSSVLSTHHVHAPLYCEDTSNSQSNDAPAASQSTFTRHRSWMDPCQSSQSSFSISIPKSKKKKKKHREISGKSREDSNRIAAKVCSKKQVGADVGRSKYLSSEITPDEIKQSSKRRKLSRKNSVLDTPLKKQVKNPTTAKTSRARQRVEVTPQKCTSVSQIQESPIRGASGRASSFFGSQAQPKALKTFAIKDGFKTPNRPVFNLKTTPSSSTEDLPSLFRSPDQVSQSYTPPGDCHSQHSQNSNSQNSNSQHSFTPPGTPRSGRKFVKKLSYNSPMRALFVTSSQFQLPSPKRKPLDSDYIQMKASPSRSILDKENEPFFPTLKHFDNLLDPKLPQSDTAKNTLEPIIHPRVNEDAQMPTFQSSPYQGTINLQSKGGFLKLLEESNSASHGLDGKRDSDNESDISAVSVSSIKSILKSPFTTGRRKKRNVSFSLDLETPFSSDNESEIHGSKDFSSLLNLVDGSIKSDEMVNGMDMFGCEPLANTNSVPPPELGNKQNSQCESSENPSGAQVESEKSADDDGSVDNNGLENSGETDGRKRKRSDSPSL